LLKKKPSRIDPKKVFDGDYYVTVGAALEAYDWLNLSFMEFLCEFGEIGWLIEDGIFHLKGTDLQELDKLMKLKGPTALWMDSYEDWLEGRLGNTE
jgi:hypothetical protein